MKDKMATIKLKKRYPDIPEETVIEIFQRGYLEGWNNARKKEHLDLRLAEAIPLDRPFLKMKYKGYTVYKSDWLKENIDTECAVIKGISEAKPKAIPIEHLNKKVEEYIELGLNSVAKELNVIIAEWRKENETD